MRLRQLFEGTARRIVAVMPGGFHPFHPGHKSLYDWAVQTFGKDNVYVAATDDTAVRPFPFVPHVESRIPFTLNLTTVILVSTNGRGV